MKIQWTICIYSLIQKWGKKKKGGKKSSMVEWGRRVFFNLRAE